MSTSSTGHALRIGALAHDLPYSTFLRALFPAFIRTVAKSWKFSLAERRGKNRRRLFVYGKLP